MAHPEGERCLVVTSRGSTISRRRNGSILHRFPSRLPNGATPARPRSGDAFLPLPWGVWSMRRRSTLEESEYSGRVREGAGSKWNERIALLPEAVFCLEPTTLGATMTPYARQREPAEASMCVERVGADTHAR